MNNLKLIFKKNLFIYILSKIGRYLLFAIYKLPENLINATYAIAYYNSLKILMSNHLTIGIKELIKVKTSFPHPVGIVIGKHVKLGENCKIYQNVTIGSKNSNGIPDDYPKIGDNVTIYANCVLIGAITIGNNVIIGAGTIVTKSIPNNSIVVGNPCRILKLVSDESVLP